MNWICLLAATFAAAAQTPPPELASQIQQVRYPPLARQARIQGTVRLAKTNGAVTVLAGHPLLIPIAFRATEALSGLDNITVTVRFEFTGERTYYVDKPVVVPITNRFERSLRRLFRRQTERVIYESVCESPPSPPNTISISGAHVEIRVATAEKCLEVYRAQNKT